MESLGVNTLGTGAHPEMYHCEIVSWSDLSASQVEHWRGLLHEAGANLSQDPQWIASIADSRKLMGDMRVAMATVGDQMSGVLPYFFSNRRINGIAVHSVEFAGNLSSYHQSATGPAWERLLRHCLDHEWRDSDVLVIQNLVDSDPGTAVIRNLDTRRGYKLVQYPGVKSPVLHISGDWEGYLAQRSKKFRNKIRRVRRGFNKLGSAETRWFQLAEDVPAFLSAMLTVESRSWKTDAQMAIEEGSVEHHYYCSLLPWLASQGRMVANVEFLGDRPVAYSLCYKDGAAYGQMKTSFDHEYAEHSVGTVAISNAIERAFQDGMKEFDFLGDLMPHKTVWTHDFRSHTTHYLFGPSLRGALLGTLKRMARSLPSETRSFSQPTMTRHRGAG